MSFIQVRRAIVGVAVAVLVLSTVALAVGLAINRPYNDNQWEDLQGASSLAVVVPSFAGVIIAALALVQYIKAEDSFYEEASQLVQARQKMLAAASVLAATRTGARRKATDNAASILAAAGNNSILGNETKVAPANTATATVVNSTISLREMCVEATRAFLATWTELSPQLLRLVAVSCPEKLLEEWIFLSSKMVVYFRAEDTMNVFDAIGSDVTNIVRFLVEKTPSSRDKVFSQLLDVASSRTQWISRIETAFDPNLNALDGILYVNAETREAVMAAETGSETDGTEVGPDHELLDSGSVVYGDRPASRASTVENIMGDGAVGAHDDDFGLQNDRSRSPSPVPLAAAGAPQVTFSAASGSTLPGSTAIPPAMPDTLSTSVATGSVLAGATIVTLGPPLPTSSSSRPIGPPPPTTESRGSLMKRDTADSFASQSVSVSIDQQRDHDHQPIGTLGRSRRGPPKPTPSGAVKLKLNPDFYNFEARSRQYVPEPTSSSSAGGLRSRRPSSDNRETNFGMGAPPPVTSSRAAFLPRLSAPTPSTVLPQRPPTETSFVRQGRPSLRPTGAGSLGLASLREQNPTERPTARPVESSSAPPAPASRKMEPPPPPPSTSFGVVQLPNKSPLGSPALSISGKEPTDYFQGGLFVNDSLGRGGSGGLGAESDRESLAPVVSDDES